MASPRRPFLILALMALLAVPARAETMGVQPPVPIPADRFDLGAYSGKVVLVDFWASWCKPCKKSLPWLRSMQETFGDQGLVVVAVNLDKAPGKAKAMMQELGADVVQVTDPDGTLAEAYGLEAVPSTFLYDRQGKLVSSHKGFDPDEADGRKAELNDLLAEETK